jgi:pyruvate/2-oxoglutarate dehydrogenase complex dihydrolipoamide acyltransferase (E2) component
VSSAIPRSCRGVPADGHALGLPALGRDVRNELHLGADIQVLVGHARDVIGTALDIKPGSMGRSLPGITAAIVPGRSRRRERTRGDLSAAPAAIIGFGRIVQRPWVVERGIQARHVVVASLAGDHCASDGHVGGLLLAAIDRALQQPQAL